MCFTRLKWWSCKFCDAKEMRVGAEQTMFSAPAFSCYVCREGKSAVVDKYCCWLSNVDEASNLASTKASLSAKDAKTGAKIVRESD